MTLMYGMFSVGGMAKSKGYGSGPKFANNVSIRIMFTSFCTTNNGGIHSDHVDLWNINEMARGDRDYITRSEEVWFWKMP